MNQTEQRFDQNRFASFIDAASLSTESEISAIKSYRGLFFEM
jgi:hypothetical protein